MKASQEAVEKAENAQKAEETNRAYQQAFQEAIRAAEESNNWPDNG